MEREKRLRNITLAEAAEIDLFKDISEKDLDRLFRHAERKKLQAGEFFFLQGDPAEKMFLLAEGRVKLTQTGPAGQQVLIRMIKPFEIFALVAMISKGGYLVSAQAAVDSEALYWRRSDLMPFVLQVPRLSLNAIRIIAEQLGEIQERYRQATTERVEQRLAHTLLRLASEAGKYVDEGIQIDLPLTRQELAEMSGTTLYTASRTLNQWQEQGIVIARRRRLIVRDTQGLEEIVAGF